MVEEVQNEFWFERRYLPHFDDGEAIQHVTLHLADSVPRDVIKRLDEELHDVDPERRRTKCRKRIEEWLDAGYGSCILREPEVAELVEKALLYFDGERYRLFAWVVMPNHVHVLFHPINGWKMKRVVASWKKYTARRILEFKRNLMYRRNPTAGIATLQSGAFKSIPRDADGRDVFNSANQEIGVPSGRAIERVWHREYWDRFIRSSEHFKRAVEYIHDNPVKAGLVSKAGDWRWSSAWCDRSLQG